MVPVSEGKKGHLYQVRVVATNGESAWDLCWAKVRPGTNEIQCGISSPDFRYHSSFHQSGQIRVSEEPLPCSLERDPPAVAQIGSGDWSRLPLDQFTSAERVGSFVLLIDDTSLQDYPPFRKKGRLDSIVYVDTRVFEGAALGISLWVSPRDQFFQRMPKPPGFRHIAELPTGEDRCLWFIIDVDAGN